MSDILVIRCNTYVSPKILRDFRDVILKQKESGVIVLPAMFDAIVVPDDAEIRVENKEDV